MTPPLPWVSQATNLGATPWHFPFLPSCPSTLETISFSIPNSPRVPSASFASWVRVWGRWHAHGHHQQWWWGGWDWTAHEWSCSSFWPPQADCKWPRICWWTGQTHGSVERWVSAQLGLMRPLFPTSEEPLLGFLEKHDRSLTQGSWRQWERGFVYVFPVVKEIQIKSLGENLSLCRINNNSSYHLLSTSMYYTLGKHVTWLSHLIIILTTTLR